MSLPPLAWILGLVVLQRLGELWLAGRNTRALLARGAKEVGRGHYPWMVAMHAAWLIAIAVTTDPQREPVWPLIGVFVLLQAARVWVIASLGPWWTTRIITLEGAPLVRRGPYRFLRHPNYWVVAAEIAVLPLAFGNWPVALVFTVLNALMLHHRIRAEQDALGSRMQG